MNEQAVEPFAQMRARNWARKFLADTAQSVGLGQHLKRGAAAAGSNKAS